MNPLTLLKQLLSGIPAKDHIVSVNDARKGPVTSADVRLNGATVEFHYVFTSDGNAVDVKGKCRLDQLGKPGGEDEIKINDVDVTGDDIVMKGLIVTGGPVVAITFKFQDAAGQSQRIRIDALKRLLPI